MLPSSLSVMVGGAAGETSRLVGGLRWHDLGRSSRAAWGRCEGSAAAPYQTVVSVARPEVTSCSCPSLRRPCKHALGLVGLATQARVPAADEPPWVAAVLAGAPFAQPGPTRRQPGAGPADPVAAAQRARDRHDKVAAGLVDLRLWLADQVRSGLADLPRAGYGPVDTMAARMVDAQAPGVAGVLRGLPADLVAADWPTRVLHTLGGLHLLAAAHRRLDTLPPELAATVRARIGYPTTKDQVRSLPAVVDRWWAIAAVDTVEFQLTSRRVWLRGLDSGRWALWLTFAPPGRDLDTSVRPGRVHDCEVRYYPGSGQFRVLLEPALPDPDDEADSSDPSQRSWGGDDVATLRSQLAELLAADPWASRLPVVATGVPVPSRGPDDPWLLVDPDGRTVPLTGLDGDPWPLVAQAGGEPLQLMGEFDGHALRPLAVLPDERGRRYDPVVA